MHYSVSCTQSQQRSGRGGVHISAEYTQVLPNTLSCAPNTLSSAEYTQCEYTQFVFCAPDCILCRRKSNLIDPVRRMSYHSIPNLFTSVEIGVKAQR